MAVLKLSQIATTGSAPALTDNMVSVLGGTTDNQISYTQAAQTLQTATWTFNQPATFTSTLAVVGASIMTGNVGLGGTLSVTGAISGLSTLAITGASNVTGNALFGGSVTATGDLSVATATITGKLNLTGTSIMTGNVGMAGNLNVTGGGTFLGDISAVTGTITGKLSVTGTSIMTGNVGLAGTLNVTGNAIFLGNISVTGTNSVIGLQVYRVAVLPAATTTGQLAFLSDSNTASGAGIGVAVTGTGGGANRCPVFSNGVNWIII